MPESSANSLASRIVPIRTRFWLGSILPALILVGLVALLLATGRGRREAPMIVFFASLVAIPGLVLANCWTLFVRWSSPVHLALSAAALPSLFLLGAVLFVHGTGRWQEVGMLVLAPFLHIPLSHIGWLAAAWLAALVGLLLSAKQVAMRAETN
jgi:hypothetical protein